MNDSDPKPSLKIQFESRPVDRESDYYGILSRLDIDINSFRTLLGADHSGETVTKTILPTEEEKVRRVIESEGDGRIRIDTIDQATSQLISRLIFDGEVLYGQEGDETAEPIPVEPDLEGIGKAQSVFTALQMVFIKVMRDQHEPDQT
jgi:hypothetical protein